MTDNLFDITPMTPELKKDLIRYAGEIVEYRGFDALLDHTYNIHACGCMGPSAGYAHCHCTVSRALAEYLVEIVAEFDEEAAHKLAIRQVVGMI